MSSKLAHVVATLGTICFLAGVISFLVYPDFFSMTTYMSENALSPSWSIHAYSTNKLYTNLAYQFSAEYYKFQISLPAALSHEDWSKKTAEWIAGKLVDLHLNPRVVPFPQEAHPSVFSPSFNQSGSNMHLVEMMLESPRSLGAEAVILTSRFERLDSTSPKPADTASYSWAFLASFLHMVQHQHWRSKDIVVVFSPEPAKTRGVEFWIERLNNIREGDDLQYRHSFIIASLSIELPPSPRFQILSVKPESALGILPNLDLPNSIFRVAYQRDLKYLTWTRGDMISFESLPWLYQLSQMPMLSKFITSQRVNDWNTMFSFMFNMALGEPTGDHSVISKYKIEAVTISASETDYGVGSVKKMGEMLEGTLRSLNNLIEPLHQSFYYYIPLGPFVFVPIGHYMISFGLLFAPTALWVLLTVFPATQQHLLAAASHFFSFALVGLLAFILPSLLPSLLSIIQIFYPEDHSLLTNTESVAGLYLSFVLGASVIAFALSLSSRSSPSPPSASPSSSAVPSADSTASELTTAHDVVGAIAFTPYLLFMVASVLLNASFAMITISLTLPGLSFTLLKRKGPRFLRFGIALLFNPISLLALYSYFAHVPPHVIVSKAVLNWELHRGLSFPLACILLPLSLQAASISLHSH